MGVPHVVHCKGGQLNEELDDEADCVHQIGLEIGVWFLTLLLHMQTFRDESPLMTSVCHVSLMHALTDTAEARQRFASGERTWCSY